MSKYYFDKEKTFIIEDYQRKKTFSSFLPGIAGEKGIPIWSFYVNRGQGISGFGIKDKDNPIMEFFPANSAYQYVGTYGFRTFIKEIKNNLPIYEPFSDMYDNTHTKMGIEKDSFFIEETMNQQLVTNVRYTTLSNVPFGGIVRQVKITNISKTSKTFEIIDGMPALLPYGIENELYKKMSNLLRSWMEVSMIEKKIPYYKLRSSTTDEAVVSKIDSGYFYMNDSINDDQTYTIYDPNVVFGYRNDLRVPENFKNNTFEYLSNQKQIFANKVPSAFQMIKRTIEPNQSIYINSIIGYTVSYDQVEKYGKIINLKSFVNDQFKSTKKEVDQICDSIKTTTSSVILNEYFKQSYLDNVLRGGKPIFFEGKDNPHVYHIYSRKHGDQERDYNFFSLESSNYSQGNGNFRDVNQNRRNDVIMDPEVFDFNVWMFYSLIQNDGYNPLSVKGTYFTIEEESRIDLVSHLTLTNISINIINAVNKIIKNKFTPGSFINDLYNTIDNRKLISTEISIKILKHLLKFAEQNIDVDFKEGFWSDHFTYNLDLIETLEYIYPDRINEFMFEKHNYAIYNAPYYVLPRHLKYGLTKEGKIRQYNSIDKKPEFSNEWVLDENSKLVQTNLFNKLLVLVFTKFMNIDPFGMGIEMEGDRPGWNDALNGLPGLFGSGMSETVELLRSIKYLISLCKNTLLKEENVFVLFDISELIINIDKTLIIENKYELWNSLNDIKEEYRNKTINIMQSTEMEMKFEFILNTLNKMLKILEDGVSKALKIGDGVLPTYFVNKVTKYETLANKTVFGLTGIKALEFETRAIPLFLEGPARYMKTLDKISAKDLYSKVKNTDIYDNELKMYKTSESIERESMEIGRIRAFTPGWLERESVFLHMTYKYLYSLLQSGLYEEFYNDIKTNLVPFMDPSIYGRPTTENSSFIASSVNPDKELIGQGFISRLSGSTAEVISMWIFMFIGNKGFSYNSDGLSFRFNPILKADLFDENNKITYMLFCTTKVTYINSTKLDTFGNIKCSIDYIEVDGVNTKSSYLSNDLALKLRNKNIKEITVFFK